VVQQISVLNGFFTALFLCFIYGVLVVLQNSPVNYYFLFTLLLKNM
jgi:hypothetical protein